MLFPQKDNYMTKISWVSGPKILHVFYGDVHIKVVHTFKVSPRTLAVAQFGAGMAV